MRFFIGYITGAIAELVALHTSFLVGIAIVVPLYLFGKYISERFAHDV